MGTHGGFQEVPSLTIPSGQTRSNILPAPAYVDCVAMLLYGPDALDAHTFTIEVHSSRTAGAATPGWDVLEGIDGTNLAPPGAGKARAYTDLPLAGSIRLASSAAVAAARTWAVTGVRTL